MSDVRRFSLVNVAVVGLTKWLPKGVVKFRQCVVSCVINEEALIEKF